MSYPLHYFMKRFTDTSATNKVLVETAHELLRYGNSTAHNATNTERAPDPNPSDRHDLRAEWKT